MTHEARYPDGCETDTEHYQHKQRGLPRPQPHEHELESCDDCRAMWLAGHKSALTVDAGERHEWPDGVPDLPNVRPTFSTTNAMTPDEAETYAKRGIARRDALIEVVSEHPRWTEEDQCNICPGTEPYEQHIAPFLEAQIKGEPWKKGISHREAASVHGDDAVRCAADTDQRGRRVE